jgi:hypothetical protein
MFDVERDAAGCRDAASATYLGDKIVAIDRQNKNKTIETYHDASMGEAKPPKPTKPWQSIAKPAAAIIKYLGAHLLPPPPTAPTGETHTNKRSVAEQ